MSPAHVTGMAQCTRNGVSVSVSSDQARNMYSLHKDRYTTSIQPTHSIDRNCGARNNRSLVRFDFFMPAISGDGSAA